MSDTILCGDRECNPAPAFNVNWSLQFSKICKVELACTTVSLPDISIGEVNLPTPFSKLSLPGEKIDFGKLGITFLVDEYYQNYREIFSWMMKIGFPESHNQFPQNDEERKNLLTDASLTLVNSDGKSPINFQFEDLWPSNLGSLEYTSQENTPNVLVCSVTFSHRMFKILEKNI